MAGLVGEEYDLELDALPGEAGGKGLHSAEAGDDIDEKGNVAASTGSDEHVSTTEAAALKEAVEAMETSEKLCARLDPEEEPYKSKYLAREALRIAIDRLSDHTSHAARVAIARLELHIGSICMDVEETHVANQHLEASINAWCPHIVEVVNEMPLDSHGKSKTSMKEEDTIVDELLAHVLSELKMSGGDVTLKDVIDMHFDDLIDAVSHLGIYHHNFEHFEHSMVLLKLSEKLIEVFNATLSRLKESAESKPVNELAERTKSLFTHICFYLAQAYAATQQIHLSARYCQLTLEHQLSSDKFDPFEWYRNCAGLVDYFVSQDRYRDAEHCLHACDRIIQTRADMPAPPVAASNIEEMSEKLTEARNDMERRWGVFYLNILQDAARLKLGVETEQPVPERTTDFSKELPELPESTTILPGDIISFEQAREVFKLAFARHQQAMQFYVMDGFVTDHVALLRDMSQMYHWLSIFEVDEKRRQAMYQRRVDLLHPVMHELGRSAFSDLLRAVSFEVGEVYQELVELKQRRIVAKQQADPGVRIKAGEVKKVNEFCEKAIESYDFFAGLFRQEKPVPLISPTIREEEEEEEAAKKKTGVERLPMALAVSQSEEERWDEIVIENDDLEVYLRAQLYIARLYGKVLPVPKEADPKATRVKHLTQSLRKYEWLSSFAPYKIKAAAENAKADHKIDAGSFFVEELRLCNEMIKLLPTQIQQTHYH